MGPASLASTQEPMLVAMNALGRLTHISDATARFVGSGPTDLIGKPSLTLVAGESVNAARAAYVEALQTPMKRVTASVVLRRAGGQTTPASLVILNRGSAQNPDVVAELRPTLPPPPENRSELAPNPVAGLPIFTTEQAIVDLDELLSREVKNFALLLVGLTVGQEHLMALLEVLGGRLSDAVRGTDRLYTHDDRRFMVILRGVETREELFIVLDRVRACLSFPCTIGDQIIVAAGAIGVALPAATLTGDHMLHIAASQLRVAAAEAGPFPARVEARVQPRT